MNNDILKNLPWITKDGYLDLKKVPIETTLRQAASKNDEEYCAACGMLISLCAHEREEVIIFTFGLLEYYSGNIQRKEQLIKALGFVKTKKSADLLFKELNTTPSSNSTRGYLNTVLKTLSHLPLEIIESGFKNLLADKKWTYRMRDKFREIIEEKYYRQS